MADTKISALTAATTPLVGTEVLPIVQGGATVKVSVDNLTAGKPVSMTALTATSGVISANSATNALRITQTGAGNALVVEDAANPDSTPFVVTSDGIVIRGYTDNVFSTGIQTVSTSPGNSAISVGSFAASGLGAPLRLYHSRSGVIPTNTIVQSADELGKIEFYGADGASYIQGASITASVDGTPGTNDMPGRLVFSTTADGASTPTERMRIDAAGNVGIGGTPSAGRSLTVSKTLTGATTATQVLASTVVQSDVTVDARIFCTNALTQATAFTLTSLNHYIAIQSTIGAGSSVTSQYGFHANSTLVGATNNYGFYSNIPSGTGRWNFYANGTADNYFGGSVGIGVTTPNASALLDVQSTTKGVRMPNMTTTQKNAIASPAAGLMVFDTTLAKLCVYSGAAWQTITSV